MNKPVGTLEFAFKSPDYLLHCQNPPSFILFSSGILYGVSLGVIYISIMDAPEREKKFGKFIPIIIENHANGLKKTKLMVPSHYRASQLLNILRAKMQMSSVTPLYLFLKGKHRPLQVSKCIGHLHQKYRNEKGCLHLIQADQSTFGFRGNIRAIRFRHKWMENYPRQAPILASFLLQDLIPPSESLQLIPTEGFINEIQVILPGPMPVMFDFIEPILPNPLPHPTGEDMFDIYSFLSPGDIVQSDSDYNSDSDHNFTLYDLNDLH
ncbi:map1lc3b [Trichonephila clavata]|uniref:Map1lc3b n=1 Tax=Trichonephila clavata TaxID=2740835 RepID=A0A8X6M5N3_TRICU|nr:map1lc3b [Trichonephila clavata]